MVKYCIDKQRSALSELRHMAIPSEIMRQCTGEWSEYRMIQYCAEKQLKAKRALENY
jgi:hypothetical protein